MKTLDEKEQKAIESFINLNPKERHSQLVAIEDAYKDKLKNIQKLIKIIEDGLSNDKKNTINSGRK